MLSRRERVQPWSCAIPSSQAESFRPGPAIGDASVQSGTLRDNVFCGGFAVLTLAIFLQSLQGSPCVATGQCQGMIRFASIGGRLRMHINYSDSLRWFAVAAITALMTLGAFFGILEMVKHGVIPQTLGLLLE